MALSVAVAAQTASSASSLSTAQPQTSPQPASDAARRQAYTKFIEAHNLRGNRRVKEAIDAYKEAIRLDPLAAEPHVDLGELYFFYSQPQLDLVEREGLEAVRLDPKNIGGRILLARLYMYMTAIHTAKEPSARQIDRALEGYKEVVALEPVNAEAWALMADLYRRKGDTASQIDALEHWAAAASPNETFFYRLLTNNDLTPDQAYFELSYLYLGQGKKGPAIEAARRSYEADPESKTYSRNLINILRQAASTEEELRLYAHIAKTADSPVLEIGYSAALVRAGRNAEAVERLRNYLAFDPTNGSAVRLLAVVQRRAGSRADAVDTLKAGISKADGSQKTSLVLDLGETYEEMGRTEDATTEYERAFDSQVALARGSKVAPQDIDVLSQIVSKLARAYRRAGSQVKLQNLFTRARPLLGDNNSTLDVITIESLREDGKRREALDLTRTAVKRFPGDRSLQLTEALILSDLKKYGESIELLNGMLKSDVEEPENKPIYLVLSSIQMQSGQLGPAEVSVRKALEIAPGDGDLLIQLSSVQDRGGHYQASERTLRDVLQREPDNATALNNLGYAMIERGERYQEALQLIERAVSIEPMNGSFLDSLGWAKYKLGQVEQAREQLERALSYSRGSATLHEHLGDVLRDLGRLAEARKQWEKALEYAVEADETARLKGKIRDAR
jgi:tetratricopeptide (TPR) repeat protein